MPVFFFHLRTKYGLEPDDTGLDLPSTEAAYLEACEAVPGLALERLARGESPGPYAFEVMDGMGCLIWDIPFSEVFRGIRTWPDPRAR